MFAVAIFAFLIVSVILGAPMILGFAASGLLPLLLGADAYTLADFITWIFNGNSNTYLAIAFFIVSGNLMSQGNISDKVYELFAYFLGNKRGFLPICALLTATFYGMVSGSAVAVTAAVGSLCLPILNKAGYDKRYFAALLCAAGCLGMIIPPSTTVIQACGYAGLEDIVVPYRVAMAVGLTAMVFLMICSLIHTRKDTGNMEVIEEEFQERRKKGLLHVFGESIWAMLVPIIILGSIFTSTFTAPEAAAVATVYCAIVAVYIYKTLTWKQVWQIILGSIKTFAPLCVTMALGVAFGTVVTSTGANEFVTVMLENSAMTGATFMVLTVVVMSLAGFFMSSIGIVVPLLVPVAVQLNVDLNVWCAVAAAASAFSLVTPPYGYGLMIMAPMAGVPLGTLFKKVLPFWIGLTVIALLYAGVPALSAWLL
ncbi:MAG: TRAP transporter large permease subunit [Lachnospiraceae bacterium]|nr:TRAP transporter large permease subunit [Lachnospiraceae bacterium]